MAWVAIGTAVVSTAGSMIQANQAKKAMQGALGKPIDVAKIMSDAREADLKRIEDAKAAEAKYFPGTVELRKQNEAALMRLGQGIGPNAMREVLNNLTQQKPNALLQETSESILNDLRQGAALPADVQAQVFRAGLAKSGRAGLSGSEAAQGLVARDLGLTGLALKAKRQEAAANLGNLLENLFLQRQQTAGTLAGNIAGAERADAGLLANYINSQQLPSVGLTGSDLAKLNLGQHEEARNIAVANAEAANARDQIYLKGLTNIIGSIAGQTTLGSSGTSNFSGLWGDGGSISGPNSGSLARWSNVINSDPNAGIKAFDAKALDSLFKS